MILLIAILSFFLILYMLLKILSRYDNPKLFSFFIRRYEKQDQKKFPGQNTIVFTGSSVIKFWKTIGADLYPLKVLNRGIAGTKINEISYWCESLVIKYKPAAVVLYAGSNDIQGNKPRSPQFVLDGFTGFVQEIRARIPELPVYFISIIPCPAKTRWKNRDLIQEANRLIAEFCAGEKNVQFADMTHHFLSAQEQAVPDYFRKDMIHLNEKGYSLWASVLKPILMNNHAGDTQETK